MSSGLGGLLSSRLDEVEGLRAIEPTTDEMVAYLRGQGTSAHYRAGREEAWPADRAQRRSEDRAEDAQDLGQTADRVSRRIHSGAALAEPEEAPVAPRADDAMTPRSVTAMVPLRQQLAGMCHGRGRLEPAVKLIGISAQQDPPAHLLVYRGPSRPEDGEDRLTGPLQEAARGGGGALLGGADQPGRNSPPPPVY